jgi:hypothetical protein
VAYAARGITLIVGQRQVRIVEYDPETLPSVEQLAHEGAGLGVLTVGMLAA